MTSMHRLARACFAIAIVLTVGPDRLRAQQPEAAVGGDFARVSEKLRVGDSVVVTTTDGTEVTGRFFKVSQTEIILHVKNVQQQVAANQVSRVTVRRNGVLLGALIGAGVGVPFGLALRSYAHNEAGNEAWALGFPILVGLGTGVAIDAFMVRPRTVFDGGVLVGSSSARPERSMGLSVTMRF
jgi:hypothetical protein